ncbi:hypothetical protein COLO4_38592 [Corchorus olitorius]|uniref:Terpene synthase N-terminal domain-containing protein n=1 Tax=Corchorus olitorius TaxID=93759 RepID=A0A1R3FTZ0_9ROSI|nr:hypothetical protein COLO4_38592 [Corchorus olitorius]
MSSQSYAIPTSTPKTMSKENRPLANFVPEHWGDVFLSCPSELNMDAKTQVHYEELKQEVRRMLAKAKDIQPSQKLHLIDIVQRLGVAYHFQKEIEDALETIYSDFKDDKNHDLHTTALQFRLLREHGFKVDCDSSITEETFVWSFDDPKIIRASAVICRFMSDITTHKFERLREHIPSAIEIYRKQYEATEQEAYDYLNKKVKEAWQDINQEFLKPTVVPESILTRVLNLARVMDLLYKDEDAYTFVGEAAKTSIQSLFIDPIPI